MTQSTQLSPLKYPIYKQIYMKFKYLLSYMKLIYMKFKYPD